MVYELFSKRRRKLDQSGADDVYQYDQVPLPLRIQLQQIFVEAIGPQYEVDPYDIGTPSHNPGAWNTINKLLCRELGVHRLPSAGDYSLSMLGVLNFLGKADTDSFLDTLEVCCRMVDLSVRAVPDYRREELGITQSPTEALAEVNYRLREAGFGYQYEDGQLFKLNSEYTHEEVVRPALRLLRNSRFAGAQNEFLQAHRHYRNGEYPQAITEAAKAFESTLKAACDLNGWGYEKGSRASDLLKRVRVEGLWPDYLDTSFDQLLATLSSGLPKVRNEDGAHGQGSRVRVVPSYVAAYALNLAAAKISLVGEAALARAGQRSH